jgi:hypothetical protein
MSGLENEMAADSGRGRLRASDADREHVVGTLKAAYVHGLVTKDEFDVRVSQAFAARTYAELALITADIPAGLAAFLIGAQVRSSRRTRHSGDHLPPQRATHSGPGAGRQAASAPPAQQLPNPGQPQRRSKADAARPHSLNPQLSS